MNTVKLKPSCAGNYILTLETSSYAEHTQAYLAGTVQGFSTSSRFTSEPYNYASKSNDIWITMAWKGLLRNPYNVALQRNCTNEFENKNTGLLPGTILAVTIATQMNEEGTW